MKLDKELEKVGFHPSEILILNSINNKKKQAKEISEETNIPMGRIYDFLSSLTDKDLIDTDLSNPSSYSSKNQETKLLIFLDEEFMKIVDKQNKLLKLVEKEEVVIKQVYSTDYFDAITNKERAAEGVTFIKKIRRENTYPWIFHIYDPIGSIPFRLFLYEGIRKRDYDESYIKQTKEDSENQRVTYSTIPTKILMSEKSVDRFFNILKEFSGKKEAIKRINEMVSFIKELDHFRLGISKEQFPYHLLSTNKSLIIALREEKKGDRNLIGTYIKGGEVVKKYPVLFDAKFKDSIPFEKYASELKKKL